MLSCQDQIALHGQVCQNSVEEQVTPEYEPVAHHFENQLLVAGQYSDVKENLKSLEDIMYEAPESNFYIQKS